MTAAQRTPPPGGWAKFFGENVEFLLRVAKSQMGRRSFLGMDAEDVVSETLRKLIKAGLPPGANPKAYAVTTLTNTIKDLAKKRRQYSDAEADSDSIVGTEDIEAQVDDVLHLEGALGELPPREAHAIREKVINDRHWSDVAPELGVTTVQGVGKIVNRGLAQLRQMPRFANQPSDVSTAPPPSTSTGQPPEAAS